jgi:hypothetical protein
MNKSIQSLVILLILFSAFSCSTAKNRPSSKANLNTDWNTISDPDLRTLIDNQKTNSEWLQAKAKVYANIQGDVYNMQATIKIQKNKIIWLSLKKLGFEVARVYITPDSIISINRLERTYQIETTETFASQFGFPLDMQVVQDLLIGNPLLPAKMYRKQEHKNGPITLYGEEKNIHTSMIFTLPTMQLQQLHMRDAGNTKELNSNFSQYQQLKDNKYFSYLRVYEFKELKDDLSTVEIQFSDIQLDSPFEFNLEIPQRYTRI